MVNWRDNCYQETWKYLGIYLSPFSRLHFPYISNSQFSYRQREIVVSVIMRADPPNRLGFQSMMIINKKKGTCLNNTLPSRQRSEKTPSWLIQAQIWSISWPGTMRRDSAEFQLTGSCGVISTLHLWQKNLAEGEAVATPASAIFPNHSKTREYLRILP